MLWYRDRNTDRNNTRNRARNGIDDAAANASSHTSSGAQKNAGAKPTTDAQTTLDRQGLKRQRLSDIGEADVCVLWHDAMSGVDLAPDLSETDAAFQEAADVASQIAADLDFANEEAAKTSALLIRNLFLKAYRKSMLSIETQRAEKLSALSRLSASQRGMRFYYQGQLEILRNIGSATERKASTLSENGRDDDLPENVAKEDIDELTEPKIQKGGA